MQPSDKIRLYRSLFRGRNDVFAKRSPTTGAYFPEHTLNWDEFNAHKANGGRMATFKNKKLTPLTDEIILKHLTGQITIGIYPILEDNTSYFLAADFDKENWLEDCRNYQEEMLRLGLLGYIERSRSGNGGHVWVFFKDAYPCHKSRAVGLEAARKVLKLSAFDKEASFDRLFPNQDAIAKDGFGNLIAMPFQGESVRAGNTVFINPSTGTPYEDQFEILNTARCHSTKELDIAYDRAVGNTIDESTSTAKSKKLKITVGQNITLNKSQLSGALVGYLKEELNFLNTEYLTKKRLGMSLYQVQKYFRLIDESDKTISLPRGFLSRLLKFLYENNIKYEISFVTPKLPECKFVSQIKLTDQQEQIVIAAMAERQGVIVAPPGSGKTMIGMELIARHQKPTLVLVHRKQLLDQWVERIRKYLNSPKAHIGRFSSAKKSTGKEITVGLLQSFARVKPEDMKDLRDKFGTIIIDECHHIPAKTFRNVIAHLNPEYLYGLTATPKRLHNDEQLIYVYIGDIIANMADFAETDKPSERKKFDIVIRETSLNIPFNWKTDHFDLITKVISYDTTRNELVIKDILEQVALKRKTLVLSERKEHLKILELYLKGQCETTIFTGDDSAASRTSKLKQIQDGHYQVLLATGQIFGEGMNIPNIEALMFAFPFAFEAKTIQYVGRLMHSSSPKVLIDYHDQHIPFLDRQFKQRKRVYNKL
jgi:superfamily II DNA or RNA helicase